MKAPVYITALIVALLALSPADARAIPVASPATDVALAFHKLSQRQLDVDALVRDANGKTDAVRKAQMTARLNGYDPARSIFTIRTPIQVIPMMESESPGLSVPMFATDPFFFSYKLGGDAYAVIPAHIASYQTILIDKPQLIALVRHIPADGTLTLTMELKLTQADASAPMVIEGQAMWLVMAAIQRVSLWNAKDQLLWSHEAQGYNPAGASEIGGLYKDRSDDEKAAPAPATAP